MKSLEIRSWPIIRLPFAWTAGDLPCRRHFSNRLLEPVLKMILLSMILPRLLVPAGRCEKQENRKIQAPRIWRI
jgi:hypothetical protein